MIQTQVTQAARQALTETIIQAKARKELSSQKSLTGPVCRKPSLPRPAWSASVACRRSSSCRQEARPEC
jgi:hypothetical protein